MSPAAVSAASTASTASTTGDVGGITGWAISVIDALGGFGAGALIALENLFPPLPSEVILPLTGFSAGAGAGFTLMGAILWCTAGSLVGAWLLYGLGAILGRERTRKILNSLPLVNPQDTVRTEAFFDKYGSWTVFLGRMIPIFRSLISLPAGVTRMNLAKFTVLTATGSAIWNTVLISAGYALGANWAVVEEYVGVLTKIVVAILIFVLAAWIVLRFRKNAHRDPVNHRIEIGAEPRNTNHSEDTYYGPNLADAGSAPGERPE